MPAMAMSLWVCSGLCLASKSQKSLFGSLGSHPHLLAAQAAVGLQPLYQNLLNLKPKSVKVGLVSGM